MVGDPVDNIAEGDTLRRRQNVVRTGKDHDGQNLKRHEDTVPPLDCTRENRQVARMCQQTFKDPFKSNGCHYPNERCKGENRILETRSNTNDTQQQNADDFLR